MAIRPITSDAGSCTMLNIDIMAAPIEHNTARISILSVLHTLDGIILLSIHSELSTHILAIGAIMIMEMTIINFVILIILFNLN